MRDQPAALSGGRLLLVGLLAVLTLIPVTLPVAVLRPLVYDRFGVSELWASMFMSVNMIGAIAGAPLAGALGDRFGLRRRFVVIALAIDAALLWSLSLSVPFPLFMLLRGLEGVSHIVALSLILAFAAAAAAPERRGRVMGAVGGGVTLGVALGAPLGGLLGELGPLVPLRAGAAVGLTAAVVAAFALPSPGRRSPLGRGLGDMVRLIADDRAILVPLAYAFVDRFTVGFYTTTFTLFASRAAGLEPGRIGLLLAFFMLPFALLSYPFGRLSERYSRSVLLAVGSLLYGLGTASLAWWSAGQLPPVMFALGVLSAVMFVPSLVLVTDLAPADRRATALAAFNAAGSLGFVVGPLTGGLVSQLVAAQAGWPAGYRAAFVVAGLAEIACVALTIPSLRRLVRAGRTT